MQKELVSINELNSPDQTKALLRLLRILAYDSSKPWQLSNSIARKVEEADDEQT